MEFYSQKIFDSHCHPQFPQYDKDREEMIERTLEAGVVMIAVGTDLETSKQAIELSQKYEGIWATVGLHPDDATEDYDILLYQNILDNKKVVAVGEVGLDYYRTPEPEKQEIQKKVFEKFLELAVKNNKPIVIHARDSARGSIGKVHSDIIQSLGVHTNLRGVIHSFTGTKEEAEKYLDLGFYLALNGIVTYSNQHNELINRIPLDRLLIETDAPYLAPGSKRGQRNKSVYITEVAARIAQIKKIDVDKVYEATTSNTYFLFNIS